MRAAHLLVTAVISGAAILLLLQASFGSLAACSAQLPDPPDGPSWWRDSCAFLGGGVVSLGSLIGFFTVFGIAARNGILLINHFQHLEREEGMTFGRDLVVRGARERLSPILMTSLATGLALIPLVIFGERPGQEIEHPLAIVILGGLVTSTLLRPLRHAIAVPTLRQVTEGAGAGSTRHGAGATNGVMRPEPVERRRPVWCPGRTQGRCGLNSAMEYRQLGRSGLRVSTITLGTMGFGGTGWATPVGQIDVEGARKQIGLARDAGVNLIDTADVYSSGMSEEILGQALGSDT